MYLLNIFISVKRSHIVLKYVWIEYFMYPRIVASLEKFKLNKLTKEYERMAYQYWISLACLIFGGWKQAVVLVSTSFLVFLEGIHKASFPLIYDPMILLIYEHYLKPLLNIIYLKPLLMLLDQPESSMRTHRQQNCMQHC